MAVSRTEAGKRRWLILYGLSLAVLFAVGLLVAYELLPDLELVAIAALVALALRSVVHAVKRLGAPPWVAAIVTAGLIGALGAFLWLVVVPGFVQQAQSLISNMPGYLDTLADLSSQLSSSTGFVPDISQDVEQLGNLVSSEVSSLPHLLSSLTDVTFRLIIIVVLAVYMAFDPGSLISGTLRLVPDKWREDVNDLIQRLEERLRGWIVGTLVAVFIVGGGAALGLWIIGVPLALPLGILAGLLEIVPYFGPFAGALLPTLVALTVSPVTALLVVGLFVLLHLLDANLIQPQIMARYVRLHPVAVIVSFLFLSDLLGVAGAVLAIPVATFLAILADKIISKSPAYKESGNST